LNDSFPENAMAVTIVGEARKFMVRRFPSLRDLKFRLKLVKIAIKMGVIGGKKSNQANKPFSSVFWSSRFHYAIVQVATIK
jgi:polyferredoxin